MAKHISIVILLNILHGCFSTDPIIVTTKYGDVLGYGTAMAQIFYGIPFAQPPIDTLRWQRPLPVNPWSPRIVNATSRAPACPQAECNKSSAMCPPVFSEDCLYLNIFTPRHIDSPLPVMIFIPGGEFEELDASLPSYNSERLVNTTNVIVAFVQYRLGVLGFFATGSGPNDIHGNFGLLDQRLAIDWIKSNIDVFGGNPNEITLFGESAGGQSVALHYLTSDMQSFFKQAIIQSSPMTIPFRTYDEYITPGVLLAEELQCAAIDLNCFRNASYQRIIQAQTKVNGLLTSLNALLFFEPWVPVIDNQLVFASLSQMIKNHSLPLKPLLIGTVKEEGIGFIYKNWKTPMSVKLYVEIGLAFFGEKLFKVLERFPPDTSADQRGRLSQVATEWVFVCSTRFFARRSATRFSYVFNYPLIPDTDENDSVCKGHVCHGDELPFLFQSRWSNFSAAGQRISQAMGFYWTNFAKTTDVNQPANVSLLWPQTTPINEKYLLFEDPLKVQENYDKSDCDFWDQIGY